MEWGVCTTVKAPLSQILAFIAWHKHLGASHIWVHLDDGDPFSAHIIDQIDGVSAVICDAVYWGMNGGRPNRQERRQTVNIRRIYALAKVPVLAHLDVDEFLWPARPMSDILADWTGDDPFLRARPAEALHNPALADDVFTAQQFRYPFPMPLPVEARMDVLGDYTALLPKNMLSHKAGKSLFRTGIANLRPKLHAASWGDDPDPIRLPLHPDLTVLHFHAQDKDAWLASLPHRVAHGAYRFNDALAGFVDDATPQDIDAFYTATQTASSEMVAKLKAYDLLLEADLKLKEKVALLF